MDVDQLSARDAIDEIEDIRARRTALERRTSGVTWIVWGLVATGMFLSYMLWGAITKSTLLPGAETGMTRFIPWFLFVPWLLVGGLSTWVVWRSVALSVPGLAERTPLRRALLLAGLVGVGAMFPFATGLLGIPIYPFTGAMVGFGGANVMAGILGLACSDRRERGLVVASGVLLGAVAVTAAIAAGGPQKDAPVLLFSVLGPVALLVTYLGLGTVLATRG